MFDEQPLTGCVNRKPVVYSECLGGARRSCLFRHWSKKSLELFNLIVKVKIGENKLILDLCLRLAASRVTPFSTQPQEA